MTAEVGTEVFWNSYVIIHIIRKYFHFVLPVFISRYCPSKHLETIRERLCAFTFEVLSKSILV